jgi:hypothetical protein
MTSRRRAREVLARIFTLLLLAAVVAPAAAQETTSYTYDARGRLVTVNHGSTGPNANVVSTYVYDGADNRCQQIVKTDGTTGTGTCPNAVTITLSPTTLPSGTVGTTYNSPISATGGTSPYTFANTSGTLPTGLTLSSGGLLSGNPSAAATYNFTVMATDSASNTGSQAYSVTINSSGVNLTVLPGTLPGGTVGTGYSETITASGGTSPYSFTKSSGTLPAGLTLTSGGLLSGTPTTATSYSFTIKATDSQSNTGTRSYSVTISPAGNQPPVANPDNAGSMTCGDVMTYNVVANDTDPDGNYPLSLVSASGSAGIVVSVADSNDVQILSTGSSSGTKSFTYVVQDSLGAQATGNGTVTVLAPCN